MLYVIAELPNPIYVFPMNVGVQSAVLSLRQLFS
jgi:hypothetical protein